MAMSDTQERPDISERYEVATSTSNLKLDTRDGAPVTSADVILAAGMSESRLGMVLLRLHSEWDSSAKPRKVTPEGTKALSLVMRDAQGRPDMNRARREAAIWYANELRILAQSLKSRAAALGELSAWGATKGIDGDTVSAAVHHWLNSACPDCGKHGFYKAEDSANIGSRRCVTCHGTGELPEPQGAARVIGHIGYCLGLARYSLKRRLRP